MSKKILHILNTGSYSGAENVVITLIEAFRQYGEDVEFVYVSLEGSIRDVLEEKGINYEPIKKLSISEIKRVIKKHHPDIIHAHDFTASIICATATGRVPIISHIHNNPPWIKSYCINSFVYGLSCLKYKKIVGVSASVFDEYIFSKCIRSKTEVIGNPIDIQKIRAMAKKAENNEQYDVVFLGRLKEQKDPSSFVEIVNQVRKNTEIKAVMIGEGDMRTDTERKISEYGLEKNIELKGFMSNPYGILANSKMLCMPSKWEGYGLVAVEALALGKPVIAAPVGGLPGIVNENCGRLCKSNAEFADEILSLLKDREKLSKKEKGALIRADELDNIEWYKNKIKSFYTDVGR